MQPFEAYKKYVALKQHFSGGSYDYFKYGGKVNIKSSSFENRKDKYLFHKLSKKKDLEGYLISNFIENDNAWIRDILTAEAEEVYTNWLNRQQSITYIFENDIEKFDDDLNQNFIVENNHYPHMLKLFLRKEISIETMIIVDSILNVFKYWNKNIVDTIVWPDLYVKCIKYKPFIKFDQMKCKQILKKKFV